MMQHIPKTPSVSDLKDQARRLRQALAQQGSEITHSKSLELLARQYGVTPQWVERHMGDTNELNEIHRLIQTCLDRK